MESTTEGMMKKMSTGALYLKRAYRFDLEDHRMSHRLQVANSILRSLHIEPEWDHSDNRGLVGTGLLQREDHVCNDACSPIWPEWVSDEVFELAYRLADETQTERGAWHRAKASEAKLR